MREVRKELILKAINQGATFSHLTTDPPFITLRAPMRIKEYHLATLSDPDYWRWATNKTFHRKAKQLSKDIVPAINEAEEDGWYEFLDRGVPFDMQLIWECGTVWPIGGGLSINRISDATSRNLLNMTYLGKMMSPIKIAALQWLFTKGESERHFISKSINKIWMTTSAVNHRLRDMKKDGWVSVTGRVGSKEHWTITPLGVEKLILIYPHVLEMGVLDHRNSDLIMYLRDFHQLK